MIVKTQLMDTAADAHVNANGNSTLSARNNLEPTIMYLYLNKLCPL